MSVAIPANTELTLFDPETESYFELSWHEVELLINRYGRDVFGEELNVMVGKLTSNEILLILMVKRQNGESRLGMERILWSV